MKNYNKYINKKRMFSTVLELIKIDSPSLKEGKIAKKLKTILQDLGCKVIFDNAHKKINGSVGNLFAYFPGTVKSKPIMLGAHMGTVSSVAGMKPVIRKDRIESDGRHILGADCKAGITVILEVLRIIKEHKLPSPPVNIVFTICEDLHVLGSKNADYTKIKTKEGLVFDDTFADMLTIETAAQTAMNVTVIGKPAHAGLEPQKGISAIEVAAKAISKLKFGNIDNETVANIGIIEGGSATNVITPEVEIKGEFRSRNPKTLKKIINCVKKEFERAVRNSRKKIDGKWYSAKLKFETKEHFSNFSAPKNSSLVKHIVKSAKSVGVKLKFRTVNASGDVNNLFANGIIAPILGCGIHNFHSAREYLDLKDFFKSAGIALAVVSGYKK